MFQKIRKNKFFRKALVFTSVFLILATTFIFPVLAQAPDIKLDIVPSQNRNTMQVYCYDNNGLVLIVYTQNNTNQVAQKLTFVFTENYYQNYYTNNIDNDFTNLDNVIFSTLYVTRINGQSTFVSASVNNSNIYDVLMARGVDDYLYSTSFFKSYENQFLYWEEQLVPIDQAKTEGYTQALNDMEAFDRGLFSIFNAPFVFVQNIVGFEIFGVSLTEILVFILILCLGYVILRFIGGALPL